METDQATAWTVPDRSKVAGRIITRRLGLICGLRDTTIGGDQDTYWPPRSQAGGQLWVRVVECESSSYDDVREVLGSLRY